MPPSPPAFDPLVSRVIGDRFRLDSLIARGGMARVYRGVVLADGSACAVKILNPKLLTNNDPEFPKRFMLEGSVVSKLRHPHTIRLIDFGRSGDDIYFMAMEYLEGKTLQQTLRVDQKLATDRAVCIARQACQSVAEAHSLGVVHRDLKPANIFLLPHGQAQEFVKVLDFGLVKQIAGDRCEDLTATGLFLGSPKYMAPEQVRGEPVDGRTDIYSVGVVLYEMVVGRVPFDGPSAVQTMMAQVEQPAPSPRRQGAQISVPFENIILRCLEKDPQRRWPDVPTLLAELGAL